MPVPQSWDDIFTNPAQNSPQGSEPIGTQADDYIRQAFAFAKQLHDGWVAADGSVPWTANQSAGAFQLKNLAMATDAGDAVSLAYLNRQFPRGTIVMWNGTLGTIPTGWVVCDGGNGTPNLLNRVPWGAAADSQVNTYGGFNLQTLTPSQMPVHTHGYADNGHAHSISDYGHVHPVTDYGHVHTFPAGIPGAVVGNQLNLSGAPNVQALTQTNPAASNIAVAIAQSNIVVNGSGIGIAIQNAGGGQAFDNRPAFASVWFIMKT
jgi:microcystin-dependent protein